MTFLKKKLEEYLTNAKQNYKKGNETQAVLFMKRTKIVEKHIRNLELAVADIDKNIENLKRESYEEEKKKVKSITDLSKIKFKKEEVVEEEEQVSDEILLEELKKLIEEEDKVKETSNTKTLKEGMKHVNEDSDLNNLAKDLII